MTTIAQKELRNDVGGVLRRAEQGEEFTVTVAGRPVARLGPLPPRSQWVSGRALSAVWEGAAPETLANDLEAFPAGLVDPSR